MGYTWAYLTTSPEMLALTLDYLPREEPYAGLERMSVLAYGLGADVRRALCNVARSHSPPWLRCEVTDVTEDARALARLVPGRFDEYLDSDKPRWGIGVKMLVPLLVRRPLLFTDDDVLVPRDPSRLMRGGPFANHNGLDHLDVSSASVEMCEQLAEAFDLCAPWDPIDYNTWAVDPGVWFDESQDDDAWARLLRAFWRLPFTSTPDRYSNAFRVMDQRFFTPLAAAMHWHMLRGLPEKRMYVRSPDVTPPHTRDCYFVHYCAGGHKREYVERLRRMLEEGQA